MQNTKAFTPLRSAIQNLLEKDSDERVERIEKEFKAGFDVVNQHINTVTVFGSARFLEDNQYYKKARELGNKLAQNGFSVVTGGGGGIMEAANRGAYEMKGTSIGFNIELPHEQQLNSYTTESMPFRYFFARKVMLAYAASALVCFPGGFGTLDELFEVITLIQTHKMPAVPVILYGTEFWAQLNTFIHDTMLAKESAISHGDEDLYLITDDVDEIVKIIQNNLEIKSVFSLPVDNNSSYTKE
ncbi:TIGR00730 family Rossman fold protein [Candidatus Saccharibacteria bacterium]|nr:TIGR00730 family Rossman fold protein [Candidatus Saccharibacteria bacterium]